MISPSTAIPAAAPPASRRQGRPPSRSGLDGAASRRASCGCRWHSRAAIHGGATPRFALGHQLLADELPPAGARDRRAARDAAKEALVGGETRRSCGGDAANAALAVEGARAFIARRYGCSVCDRAMIAMSTATPEPSARAGGGLGRAGGAQFLWRRSWRTAKKNLVSDFRVDGRCAAVARAVVAPRSRCSDRCLLWPMRSLAPPTPAPQRSK